MSNLVEVIKTEITQTGLQENKAAQIEALYLPMISSLNEIEDEYNGLVSQTVTPSLVKAAKDLRLRIKKIRTSANNARKTAKEEYLIAGRAIQGAYNTVEFAVKSKEQNLEAIEKHFEIQEQKRLDALQESRAKQLAAFELDEIPDTLAYMTEDVFKAFLLGSKSAFDEKKKKEAEEAEKVKELERKAKLKQERMTEIMPYFSFAEQIKDSEGNVIELEEMTVKGFKSVFENAKKAKAEHEKKQIEIENENKRLKKEAEDKERMQAELISRQNNLISIGLSYNGSEFIFGDIKIKPSEIKKATGPSFAKLLSETKDAIAKIKDDKIKEDQRIEKLWRSRLDQLDGCGWNGQEAFDKSNENVIITYEAIISISNDEFKLVKSKWDDILISRKKEQEEKEKAAAEKKKEQDRRQQVLIGLGLIFNGQEFIYQDINFHWTDVLCMTNDEFNKNVKGASARMLQIKSEERKEEALKQAKIEKEAKLAAEAEAKKAPDKEKIQKLIDDLKAFEYPECASAEACKIVNGVAVFIVKILDWAKTKQISL